MNRACILLFASVLVGCGAAGKKNVAACEAYVATLDCGTYEEPIDCAVYGETTCDISAYFTCLNDSYLCEDDLLSADGDKLKTCADLAVCA